MNAAPPSTVTEVPWLTIGNAGPVAVYDARPDAAERLLAIGRRTYTGLGLALAEPVSRAWLERSQSPYVDDVAAIADRMGKPGVWTLNLSYEWGCTTGVGPTADGGTRMLRVLDWPLPGLGREVVVAEAATDVGPYSNITWPGAVGVLTANCPGRFALAINQAPMRRRSPVLPLDWMADRLAVRRSTAMPPAHLARLACETAPTYEAAKQLLTETPICIPAIFTLAGTEAGLGCVIERRETTAAVSDGCTAVANQWIVTQEAARERGEQSAERRGALVDRLRAPADDTDFSWVVPPILNVRTRLAVVAEPSSGRLTVRGYEPGSGPLPEMVCAGTAAG